MPNDPDADALAGFLCTGISVPDAAYEAAAKAHYGPCDWAALTDRQRHGARVSVRPIVDAAAGHIRAQALRDFGAQIVAEHASDGHVRPARVRRLANNRADAEEG